VTLRFKITPKGLTPAIKARQRQKLIAATLSIVAVRWHDRHSQFKFTPAAARKYNYAARRTKNVRTGRILRKRAGRVAIAPNGNPLTWTGRSKALARIRRIRANSKRSSVNSPIRVFNFKPPGNKALGQPGRTMRDEYTRVLPSEERQLGKDGERWLRRQFQSGKRNITVQFG